MKKIGIIFLVIVIGLVISFFWYVQDYYSALEGIEESVYSNSSIIKDGNMFIFTPNGKDQEIGFIFYPGGKVDELAYAPLLQQLANEGITCVLFEMPFNLAVFDSDAAKKALEELPEIKTWYIGGHSLGGAMAADYASKIEDELKGVILLAAYPTKPLNLPLLTLVGENDEVISRSKLEGLEVIEIEGGNHAYFGSYGEQKGDGVADITPQNQQDQTVQLILEFISKR